MKKNYLYTALFITSAFALASYPAQEPEELATGIIKTNDADQNGMLSKEEVDLYFRITRFDEVDQNKDGYLNHSELAQSYANAQKARQKRANEDSLVDKIPIVNQIF